MTVPRRTGGLGRGLGALIPTGPPATDPEAPPADAAPGAAPDEAGAPVAGARFAEIPVDRITPNPLQPRSHFDEEAMAELVVSIREVGLLQPVVVRQLESDEGGQRFELVMGERRWRASRDAGMTTIPAIVRETADDDMLRDALLENLHRQELNPLEEAAAYQQLLNEFGATHEELATRIGRSRPQISNTIRLLNLPPRVQLRVAAGVLSAGHARAILGLPTPEAQEAMAERVVAEGLSVRGVEEAVHLAQGEPAAESESAPARRGKRPLPAGLAELAERLSDRLETRVKVDVGKSRGKMTIEFATLDDLNRIVAVMEGAPTPVDGPPSPPVAPVAAPPATPPAGSPAAPSAPLPAPVAQAAATPEPPAAPPSEPTAAPDGPPAEPPANPDEPYRVVSTSRTDGGPTSY